MYDSLGRMASSSVQSGSKSSLALKMAHFVPYCGGEFDIPHALESYGSTGKNIVGRRLGGSTTQMLLAAFLNPSALSHPANIHKHTRYFRI